MRKIPSAFGSAGFHRKAIRPLCFTAALIFAGHCFAESIDVTSGTNGSLTSPQSFNETRAVDVTVSALDLYVTSMTLSGLLIRSGDAFVGARIYDTSNSSLLASESVTGFGGGTVTIPVSATLLSGRSYRLSFYVATSPANQGTGILFEPEGFPYTDTTGLLQINNAYEAVKDSFPTNWNIFAPQIELEADLYTHLNISLAYPNVLVMWPAAGSNANLEVTSDLTSNNWVPVNEPPHIIGSNAVVTIPMSGDSQFYRLR
jgi:hypothetical protein